MHSAQYTVHSAQYTVHSTQCTVHNAKCASKIKIYTGFLRTNLLKDSGVTSLFGKCLKLFIVIPLLSRIDLGFPFPLL